MARASASIEPYVALLRGINVGGRNLLPMAELVELFTAEGCAQVRTYIQSGNVLFRASRPLAARLPGRIAAAVAERKGFAVPVVLRTARELQAVLAGNPFVVRGAAAEALHVLFLAGRPAPARVATLDQGRSPPDEFAVRGREVYLCLPKGVARTKLTNAYFDTRLGTTSTMRNWQTVARLAELALES